MAEEADYGFMLWDGLSKGTLNNILNLLERGKKVVVYFSPARECITIRQIDDGAPGPMPKIIRLHFVRDDAMAV